ncbi:phosphatidylinositol N-acetylglucosaminyltransferase subunit A-like [Tigriopus californicus]|uniref:phosphatidylinositol N-acetylglucosaminyltransferase subunit A-like n=1 Tax=Tigriopus californicus TaxID=6832 RepID=UPI0027DA1DEE|nr:phosphatidylinositol N-acetylglucosaminyltransferase subunit A-like [Tigriopus californicus]
MRRGQGRHYRIALVSDFFYPNSGGVESHLFQLAQCLMERGHRVIIITHFYGARIGLRFMTHGLKVYYLPIQPFYNKSVLPTIVGSVPVLRRVLVSEQIEIVHGHSAFSTLGHEAIFTGALLDQSTVFTDHSLFGFADVSAVVTNTFLKFSLANVDHCICVSHTGKENTVLRSGVPRKCVSVIPNAVDTQVFQPEYSRDPGRIRDSKKVVIAIGSRLVYRKGIDLIAAIIPRLSEMTFAHGVTVDFLVGGDGPKRILFEEMIEAHDLQSRVTMLGELPHAQIRDELLARADVFLNASLTEAFCMAILEAVSCGLTVVSTKVGGIPEVLPEKFIYFVGPDVLSLETGLVQAIKDVINDRRPTKQACHEFVSRAYNWRDVAERTEIVYDRLMREKPATLARKVRNLWETGRVAGPLMAMLFLFCHYWIMLLDRVYPIKLNKETTKRPYL